MYELNKKTISTLIISILMLSMALSAMPMAVAKVGPTIHIDPQLVASAGATATWVTDPQALEAQGKVARLYQDGTADEYAYVRVSPAATITLSALTATNMPTFKYYMITSCEAPALELRFDDPSSNGWVEVTVFAYALGPSPLLTTAGTWLDTASTGNKLTMSHYAVAYGMESDGTSAIAIETGSNPLSTVIAAIESADTTAANWVLTRVTPQVGWRTGAAQTVYIDDIKIGSVTYNLASYVSADGIIRVADKVFVSGTSKTLGGSVKIYWDSVRDWDGTAGLLAETYAVGYSYSVEVTIPAAISGTHYVIVKDIEAAATASQTITVKPKISLTPSTGLVGDVVTLKGTGFADDTLVTATYIKTGSVTTPLTLSPSGLKTSALGSFTATFAIPEDAITGSITATATGSASTTLTVGKSITLTPSKGIAGTTVTVSGRGFAESSTVDITWLVTTGYSLLLVNDYDTDSSGAFTTTFTVPAVTTGFDYDVTATDADGGHATETFTMTGETAITLSPKSGLAGTTVTVTGEWFTAGKTVTIYFDATLVGTATVGTVLNYEFETSITVPIGATYGAHTVKAMDSSGVYATKTFTVSERIIVIETRSTTYMPGDTLSFDIHSTVEFKKTGVTYDDIVIKIYDPDDYLFWTVGWMPVKDTELDKWTVPYSTQVDDVTGFHLTLPSDAMAGLWKWNATYYVTDVVAKIVKESSFTVKATTASAIDEKITALEESINLLGVQILAAQTAATAAQTAATAATTAATTAGTKADAALTAATAAATAATAAATAATTAGTKADAALTAATAAATAATAAATAATAATTAANAAKTSADAAKAATDGLTTMVYVAIAASVVAALAAIFAVMQISKKIA
jgi:hypothetical protein